MHFVMVQRMLHGIQERATGQPLVSPSMLLLARVGWPLAGLTVCSLLASRRRWWPWLALTLVVLVPALVSTGDWDAALAGFLAIGITVSGGLVFGTPLVAGVPAHSVRGAAGARPGARRVGRVRPAV